MFRAGPALGSNFIYRQNLRGTDFKYSGIVGRLSAIGAGGAAAVKELPPLRYDKMYARIYRNLQAHVRRGGTRERPENGGNAAAGRGSVSESLSIFDKLNLDLDVSGNLARNDKAKHEESIT